MENNNKTGWVIAVVVIIAVALVAWWYVGESTPQTANEAVSSPQPAAENPSVQEQVAVPAPDSTSEIQKDLDAAGGGNEDLQGELDALDADIQKGF
ncbi:MAG: hypothetical protein HYW65_02805 [Candidatus Liptonbacteria bacterium]|nr:hypothetical protein [Candidatus Liptonbacteria bacterium]